MPAEYSMGYRKPPVQTRFRKGQPGNPGGRPRPRPTRRQRFAQMLEADLMEPVEQLATRSTRSTLAAWAKGMALDGVRGKAAIMRLAFSLWDELDVMEGNLEPRRRARPVRMPQELEAAVEAAEYEEEAEASVPPVSQRIIEDERLPMWGEYAGEAPGVASPASPPYVSRPAPAGRPDETDPAGESEKKSLLDGEPPGARNWVARSQAGHDNEEERETAASPLSEGCEQGLKSESERSFLAEAARNARRVPSEKELQQREKQAEAERQKRVYDSLPGKIKAFCDKHGYEYPANMQMPREAPAPPSEGQAEGITNPPPEEGPYKRALRERFIRLAAAEREEAERKAALAAKGGPLTPALSPKDGGEGDAAPPRDTGTSEPEPLPDFAIWMRGQRAAR